MHACNTSVWLHVSASRTWKRKNGEKRCNIMIIEIVIFIFLFYLFLFLFLIAWFWGGELYLLSGFVSVSRLLSKGFNYVQSVPLNVLTTVIWINSRTIQVLNNLKSWSRVRFSSKFKSHHSAFCTSLNSITQ